MALLLCTGVVVTGCYDDSDLRDKLGDMNDLLKDHESRLKELERLSAQQNTNISSLQTIVLALQDKDYVTNVSPIHEGNKVVGYTITFSKSGSVTIYNGNDGNSPVMGVKQYADHQWYWTVDGEWLLDSKGEKVRASAVDGEPGAPGVAGQAGISPKLRIVDGYWYVSYDGGKTWEEETLGQATGDAGYTMFTSVTYDEEFVYITMADGQKLTIPRTLSDNGGTDNPETPETPEFASETANCYIVSTKGSYSFATVKGNSTTSVGSVASAAVLWESFGTDVQPNAGDLIKSVSYKDGYIAFQTADTFKEGNAVIAAKDASGNILWSWHIWFTDEPQGQEYYNNAGTMMDRNLGATSATPGDVGALGLLYQWGRKDPFLGSSSISSSTLAISTISWPSAVSSDSSNGTIEYATSHPTTFITRNDSNYDWYYTGSSSTDNTRWTTSDKEKSIYDPCPAGWRVPDGDFNGVWSKALGSLSSFDYTYSSSNEGINFSGKFGSASTIWYPASGYRFNYDGSLSNVRGYGYYWSASPYLYYACCLCFSSSGSVGPSNGNGRASGLSVRCLQVIDEVAEL